MAELYDVIASQTVTEFVPPNGTRQRQEVTVTAKPSGVTFPVRIALSDMDAKTLPMILGPLAAAFNDLRDEPGVSDVQVQQDVNNNGVIVTHIIVTVESADGNLSQDVQLQWGQEFRGFGGYSKIADTLARLNAISEG